MFPLLSLIAVLGAAAPADTTLPTAAVVPFDARGVPSEQVAILEDRFRFELGGRGAFRLLERQKMDDILREQGFQQTGCVSTECAVETGRVLGVRRMIAGSVAHLGSTWSLSAREIEVETGEIRRSAVVDMQESIDAVLTRGMRDLAHKLTQGEAASPSATGWFESLRRPVPPPALAPVPVDSTPLPTAIPAPLPPGTVPFQVVLAVVPLPPAPSVQGIALDIGWGRVERMRGVQAGLLNQADSTLHGVQGGILNLAGRQQGVQAGVGNASVRLQGVQAGVTNFTGASHGLQAGLVNVADEVHGGVQFGLVNIWKRNGETKVMPFIGGIF